MPNRVRPRCRECDSAMAPLFAKGVRGRGYVRVPDAFWCHQHKLVARGRRKVRYL